MSSGVLLPRRAGQVSCVEHTMPDRTQGRVEWCVRYGFATTGAAFTLSCTTRRPLSTRSRHTLGLAVGSLNPTPTEGAQ